MSFFVMRWLRQSMASPCSARLPCQGLVRLLFAIPFGFLYYCCPQLRQPFSPLFQLFICQPVTFNGEWSMLFIEVVRFEHRLPTRWVGIRHLDHCHTFFDYIWTHLVLPVEPWFVSFYSYESRPEQVLIVNEDLLLVELVCITAFSASVALKRFTSLIIL